jgi:hypothetical protein
MMPALLGAMRERHSPALAGFVVRLRDSSAPDDERAEILARPNAMRAKFQLTESSNKRLSVAIHDKQRTEFVDSFAAKLKCPGRTDAFAANRGSPGRLF